MGFHFQSSRHEEHHHHRQAPRWLLPLALCIHRARRRKQPLVQQYDPQQLLDGNWLTYWAVDDSTMTASVELNLGETKTFNVISLTEYIPLGQRIENFEVEAKVGEEWQKITAGTTIGFSTPAPLSNSQQRCGENQHYTVYGLPDLVGSRSVLCPARE